MTEKIMGYRVKIKKPKSHGEIKKKKCLSSLFAMLFFRAFIISPPWSLPRRL